MVERRAVGAWRQNSGLWGPVMGVEPYCAKLVDSISFTCSCRSSGGAAPVVAAELRSVEAMAAEAHGAKRQAEREAAAEREAREAAEDKAPT